MARTRLNPLLNELRGAIDGFVFKRYGNRVIVSKYPDMSRVKRSPAQKAQLERMKWAVHFYRAVLADPKLQARYAKRAKTQNSTIHRLATKDYMRLSKDADRVNVLHEAITAARRTSSAKPAAHAGGRALAPAATPRASTRRTP